MADPGRRSNKNSFRSWSTTSKRSSLSPPVFRRSSHSLAPPGIWDVEFPKKHQCQQQLLKRSFSERGKPTRVFQQSATKNKANLGGDSGAARSLWSAENKEYLEVRFGLMLAHCSNMKQQQQGRDSSFSLSSEYKSPIASSEASSIFSNPDCSSFSSGSCDDFSSCKDEPTVAPVEEEEQKQEGGEDEGEVFLDFALEQGNLVSNPSISQEQGNPVNNPRAVTRTNDHPAKRHDVDCSMLESPRSKLCSPSPPISPGEENIYPIWASAENKTPSHLTRSLTGMKLQQDHQDIQRRLNFSPGRFFPPKSPKTLEPQQQLGRIQQPEVHCKSFFLRRPPSFMRRKRSKESPPMRPSDGYYTAQLHCVVRNDCQSFTFVVDGSEELLVARTIPGSKTSEEDGDEQQNIVCSFYSCKQRRLRASRSQSWKPAWPMMISSSTSSSASTCSSSNSSSSSSLLDACKAEASEIIASMKLSQRRRGDGALENEFVLTAVEHQPEPHSFSHQMPDDDLRLSFSSWEAKKSPSASIQPAQKRSWWNLVPGSPVLRRKNSKSLSTSPSRSRQEEDHEDVLKEIWKEMEAEESMRRAQAANRLQELAAFVVSSDPLKTQKESRPESITAVLPTGDHGMPTKGIAGPSPLMKRWRTGSCDCGGWDLGCTLDVFQNDLEEAHSKLLEISLQRPGRREEDAFTLVGLSNGLFSVKFREPFSALQAFGSAVAILFRSHYKDGAAVARSSESSHQWSKVLGLPAAAYQYPMHLERL